LRPSNDIVPFEQPNFTNGQTVKNGEDMEKIQQENSDEKTSYSDEETSSEEETNFWGGMTSETSLSTEKPKNFDLVTPKSTLELLR